MALSPYHLFMKGFSLLKANTIHSFSLKKYSVGKIYFYVIIRPQLEKCVCDMDKHWINTYCVVFINGKALFKFFNIFNGHNCTPILALQEARGHIEMGSTDPEAEAGRGSKQPSKRPQMSRSIDAEFLPLPAHLTLASLASALQ